MTTPAKPCAHCGGTAFHYMPQMRLPVEVATTVFGMNATKHLPGQYWAFTLVICDQCGYTQTFTLNGPELAQCVPGSGAMSAGPP